MNYKFFIIFLINLNCLINDPFVLADGLGEELLWSDDTELLDQSKPKNVLFEDNTVPEGFKEEIGKLLDEINVDVVAPNSHLTTMMNKISTKTQVMFIKDYEHYFEKLDIGSTNRPMLLSYLGLQFASQEQINSWYKPSKSRSQSHIIESCKGLINMHKKSINVDDKKVNRLEEIKSKFKNKFQIAYLTFQNNLNLFMLDEYILLCSKLEPENLNDDLKDVKLVL